VTKLRLILKIHFGLRLLKKDLAPFKLSATQYIDVSKLVLGAVIELAIQDC